MKHISKEDFYQTLQQTGSGKRYLQLIRRVQVENRGYVRGKGYEIHHIHPRKLGGDPSWVGENVVKLTIYEHCLAHLLLAKAIPCAETFYAISKISNTQYKTLMVFSKKSHKSLAYADELRYKYNSIFLDFFIYLFNALYLIRPKGRRIETRQKESWR